MDAIITQKILKPFGLQETAKIAQWFGKVAVWVDSFAMHQLRQECAITLLSGYNYIIL